MKIEIKVISYEELPNGKLQLMTNREDFESMLDNHSPNILIEYLNEKWKPGIALVKNYKKIKKGGNREP